MCVIRPIDYVPYAVPTPSFVSSLLPFFFFFGRGMGGGRGWLVEG